MPENNMIGNILYNILYFEFVHFCCLLRDALDHNKTNLKIITKKLQNKIKQIK